MSCNDIALVVPMFTIGLRFCVRLSVRDNQRKPVFGIAEPSYERSHASGGSLAGEAH